MKFKKFVSINLLHLLLVAGVSFAVPHVEEINKHRVIADREHYTNGDHHPEYDHEAFLGEEAATFDQLTPEESKRRLGVIIDKIDKNNDSEITHEELKAWIQYTQSRYLVNDVDNQWRAHNIAGKENITWDEYRKSVYGFNHDYEANELDKEDAGGYSYKNMLDRDKRRWSAADVDGDGALNRHEFASFLHPEETSHMKEIVVLETMEDIDTNKDGKISVTEYIGDMYQDTVDTDDELPEWVQNEKEQFDKIRDKDGDGFLNVEEVQDWILPSGFDAAEAEARHLIYEADSNGDEKLTEEEIFEKYDLFVGSQATDFGEALVRHDEF